jgi:hypothetical protein
MGRDVKGLEQDRCLIRILGAAREFQAGVPVKFFRATSVPLR